MAVVLALAIGLCSVHSAVNAQAVDSPAAKVDSALEPMLFEDLFRQATEDNPSIVIAGARIEQASQLSRQMGSFRHPKVEITGAVGPEYNDPAPSSDSGNATTNGRNLKLYVTTVLFDGGTSQSEFDRSKRLESAAIAEAQIVLEELYLEVVNNYIDYWRYQLELAQANKFGANMQALVSDLDKMYRGGAASKLEVDFARARLASARGLVSSATASLNNAFSELEYLSPGLESFTAISPDVFSAMNLFPLTKYIEHGSTSNSGFIVNQMGIEASQLRVAAQKGRFKPTLNFEISGSIIDDEGGASDLRGKAAAKLLLSYTLYSGGERRGGEQRAKAQLRELEAERVQLERDVFRSIDQSYNSITSSRLTLQAITDEIAANQELQRLNRKNLEMGTINIIELIDVEERLFNAYARRNEIVATLYRDYNNLVVTSGYPPYVLTDHTQVFQKE